LYPYQKEGVQRVVHQFRGRCLLADEMGLGKTLQAVAVMLHYKVETLVICPAYLQTTWRRALQEWSAQAIVCSFSKAPASSAAELVIVDEAHYLKSAESQRTQAILPLLLLAPRVLLMTGTPCPNRPEEMFALLHGIRPRLVPSWSAFVTRYCRPRRTPFGLDTRGSDRPDELRWLLDRAFWVRRTKAILTGLPDMLTSVLYVDSDPELRHELVGMQQRLDSALAAGSKLAQTVVSEMYRCTARAKMTAAVALVRAHLVAPTVIFAHHQCMLDAMEGALEGYRVGRIDGRTSMAARQRVVDGIQTGTLQVALLSMGAAGCGLTLTAVNSAYFLEIPWCPAVLRQCEARIHRIGQTSTCNVYYILAHETLDSYVWRTIHRKERVGARIGQ
jgi:SWI/SNF-related matrix-associated actin-dependent regulator 1 of chromatin subfamily A